MNQEKRWERQRTTFCCQWSLTVHQDKPNIGGSEAREPQSGAGHSPGRSLLCCWGLPADPTHTERCWNLPHWRYSRSVWTQSCAESPGMSLLSREVGAGEALMLLTHPVALWHLSSTELKAPRLVQGVISSGLHEGRGIKIFDSGRNLHAQNLL